MDTARPRPPPLNTSPPAPSPASPPASSNPNRLSKAFSIFKVPAAASSPVSPTYPQSIPLSHPALTAPPTPLRSDLPSVYVVGPPEEGQQKVLAFDSRAPPSPQTPDLALLEQTVVHEAQQRAQFAQHRRLPPPDIGIPKFRRLTDRQMRMEGVVMPRRRTTAPPPRVPHPPMVRRSDTDPIMPFPMPPQPPIGALGVLPSDPGSPGLPPSPPPNMPLPPLPPGVSPMFPSPPMQRASVPVFLPSQHSPLAEVESSDSELSALQGPAPPRRIGSPPPHAPFPVPPSTISPSPIHPSRPPPNTQEGLGIYAPPVVAPVPKRPPPVPFPRDPTSSSPTPPPSQAPPMRPTQSAPPMPEKTQGKHIEIVVSSPPRGDKKRERTRSGPAGAGEEGMRRKRSSTIELMKRRSGFFAPPPLVPTSPDGVQESPVEEKREYKADEQKEKEKEKGQSQRGKPNPLGTSRRRSLFFPQPPILSGSAETLVASPAESESSPIFGTPEKERKEDETALRPPRMRSQSEKGLRRPKSIVGFAGLVMGSIGGASASPPMPGQESTSEPPNSAPVGSRPSGPVRAGTAPVSPVKDKKEREKKEGKMRRPKSLMGLGRHFSVPLKGGGEVPPVPPVPALPGSPSASPKESTGTLGASTTSKQSRRKSFYNLPGLSLSHHLLGRHEPSKQAGEQAQELPGVKIDGVPRARRKGSVGSASAALEKKSGVESGSPRKNSGSGGSKVVGSDADAEGGGKKLRRPKSLAGLGAFIAPSKQAKDARAGDAVPQQTTSGERPKPSRRSTAESRELPPLPLMKRPETASTTTTSSSHRPETASTTTSSAPRAPTTRSSTSSGPHEPPPTRKRTSTSTSSDSPRRPGTSMSDRTPPPQRAPPGRVRTLSLGATKRISTMFNFPNSSADNLRLPAPALPPVPTLPTIPSQSALPTLPESASTSTLKTPVTPSFPSRTQLGILTSTPLSSECSPASDHTSSPSLTSDSQTDEGENEGSTDPSSEMDTVEDSDVHADSGRMDTLELDVESSPCSSAYDSAKEDFRASTSPSVPSLKLSTAPFQGLGIDLRSFGVAPT